MHACVLPPLIVSRAHSLPWAPPSLQGFSTISAIPCTGYSWCEACPDGKANVCALKGPGGPTAAADTAYTSGRVAVPRNFSSNVVVKLPPSAGALQGA